MLDRFRPESRTASRRFDAAGGGRRWEGTPSFGSHGAETLAAAPVIRSRARHAVANNPHAAAAVEALVTGLVGAGITPASRHPEATARKAVGETFMRWSDRADADGLTDVFGLQAAIATALVIDGEAFAHLTIGEGGFAVRLVPAEFVDEGLSRELGGGARIVAGVEFSSDGKRIAYWVRPADPTDVFATAQEPIRIPASDMLHVYRPMGAGQVRGISWLTPVLLKLGEIDQLSDALLVGTKVAAMHAGFLVDQNNLSGENPFDGDQTGSVLESGLEPGTLRYLPGGYDIKFATPQQAQQSVDFMAAELRAVASGLGVPAHLVSGDLSDANYSSLRASMVSFRQRVERIQNHVLIPQFVRPVFERAVIAAVLSGDLDAPDFERSRQDWMSAEFYPPRMPWVDPQKDAAAVREMLDSKLMSRRQAVAELGWNIEAVDEEIAADRAREAELGLSPQPENTDARND
ncbi:phage portal protein [uncultured Erythrobacter sp.]|uniref:phage portal protein n=1 Tax=uncultured Erythrobacter sp. TaxID=263913 RepID=UPI00262BE90E|nr:phage portal protein [uncultured Erythrobacter sp.]